MYMIDKETMLARLDTIENEAREIRESLNKKEKWQPKGGEWYLTEVGEVFKDCSSKGFQDYGVEFSSEEAANRAAKDFRAYHRLWHLADELNEGWIPNWYDRSEPKAMIAVHENNSTTIQRIQSNYFVPVFKSSELAEKALELIKNGALE